jgi:tetraacyldisaccharide 4'-kinase
MHAEEAINMVMDKGPYVSRIYRLIDEIHYGRVSSRPIKFFLLPFLNIISISYGFLVMLRDDLYRLGILKKRRLPAKVISIGNLTAGGSGKTPLAIHIARIFRDEGRKVAIISRGYKKKGKKAIEVVSDSISIIDDWSMGGDEPLMIARSLPDTVIVVGKDRISAGLKAIEISGADIIILDDAFQYLKLERDLDILVFDGSRGIGNGRLLPRGPLREGLGAMRRADIIIITKKKEEEWGISLPFFPSIPVFYGLYRIASIKNPFNGKTLPPSFLKGKRVIAFCGIGNPGGFISMIEEMGAMIVKKAFFADHHVYRPKDIEMIISMDESVDIYLTTEKDMIKIEDIWRQEIPIYAIQIELEILEKGAFRRCLMDLSGKSRVQL